MNCPSALTVSFRLALALASFCPAALAQWTWYVDCTAPAPGSGTQGSPYASIQYAISRPGTAPEDSIMVRPGTYDETIDFMGKSLRVISEAGAAVTTIDAGAAGSVVTFRNGESPECRLEGFTLRNGAGRYIAVRNESLGGGIYCVNSSPTIVNCTIAQNSTRVPTLTTALSGRGGGIYCGPDSHPTLLGCSVAENDALQGGGIFLEYASLTMDGGTVLSNRALGELPPARGGGILVSRSARIVLQGVEVRDNVAVGSTFSTETLGGGIRVEFSGSASIQGCTIAANDSGGFSQGYGDLAGYGGGISSAARAADVTITATTIRDNWGNNGGGGVHGTGTLSQCVIAKNHGQFGGGVSARDMTLTNCELRENRGSVSGSYDWGGGIYVEGSGRALLQSCDIHSNSAFGQGAGGWGGTYVNCDIHDNDAVADASAGTVAGGGVYGGELIDCRVWNNVTEEYEYGSAEGGGLYGGSASRCLIFENDADSYGGAANASLRNCTVVSNRSLVYPGGGVSGGSVLDSIVRFNFPDDVTPGTSVSYSNVPIGVPGSNNVTADPRLWNVAMRDFHLRPDSPCIDAGNPASPPDPDGSRVDMGALPFDVNHCGSPVVYCTAKVNSLSCTPAIATNNAVPSIAGGSFEVRASNVRNQKSGLLFWGLARAELPFQGGFLCALPPIVRTAPADSGGSASGDDCTGAYAFAWTSAYIAAHQLVIGNTLFCQFWSRDPGAANGSGLTDALEFTLCP